MFALLLAVFILSACGLQKNTVEDGQTGNSLENYTNQEFADLTDGTYQIELDSSSLTWKASKVLAAHSGLVSIKSGEVIVSGGQLSPSDVVLDMTTITSDEGLDSLVRHLKSADFFNIEEYPEARLVIKSSVFGSEPGEYVVSGDLTIKGITNPIDFRAKTVVENGRLLAKAEIIIDRTNWDIRYRSGKFFQDLGDNLISDEISFIIDLNASRME